MKQIILFFLQLLLYSTHMELSKPSCRRSRFNKNLVWSQIDYSNLLPIGTPTQLEYPMPCRGAPVGNITETLIAGQDFLSRITGDISHHGGHCEWSISYDGLNFVVIKTIIGTCLTLGTRQYMIPLPPSSPQGQAVLLWSWVNRTGLREFYMNCADVFIKNSNGGNGGRVEGPAPVIANVPGYPVIPQFTFGIAGQELYEGRPILSVGRGEDGSVLVTQVTSIST